MVVILIVPMVWVVLLFQKAATTPTVAKTPTITATITGMNHFADLILFHIFFFSFYLFISVTLIIY